MLISEGFCRSDDPASTCGSVKQARQSYCYIIMCNDFMPQRQRHSKQRRFRTGFLTIVKHDEPSQTLAIISLASVTMALHGDETSVADGVE
jgi:hypothetical protein